MGPTARRLNGAGARLSGGLGTAERASYSVGCRSASAPGLDIAAIRGPVCEPVSYRSKALAAEGTGPMNSDVWANRTVCRRIRVLTSEGLSVASLLATSVVCAAAQSFDPDCESCRNRYA